MYSKPEVRCVICGNLLIAMDQPEKGHITCVPCEHKLIEEPVRPEPVYDIEWVNDPKEVR